MKRFIVSALALLYLYAPGKAHADELQVDPLKDAYYFVWSSCANCGPQKKGLHFYVSQIVFTGRYDHKNLGGAFYAKVRNMPNSAPNGATSNGFLTYDGALAKRREMISDRRSSKYSIHHVSWATTRRGNHGDTKQGKVPAGTTHTTLPPRPPTTVVPGTSPYYRNGYGTTTRYRTKNRYRTKRRYRSNTRYRPARRVRRGSRNKYRRPARRVRSRRYNKYRYRSNVRRNRRYKTRRSTYRRPRRTYRSTRRIKRRTRRTYRPTRRYKTRTRRTYRPRRRTYRRSYKRSYKPRRRTYRRSYKRRSYKRRSYKRTYKPRRRTYKRYRRR